MLNWFNDKKTQNNKFSTTLLNLLSDDLTNAEYDVVFKNLWFDQVFIHIYANKLIPSYLSDYFPENDTENLGRFFSFSENNEAIKLLFYNWASDPLFYKDVQAQEVLINEQRRAVHRFLNTADSTETILSDFIWESGLLSKVAQTFDLSLNDFEPIKHKKSIIHNFLKRWA